MTLGEPMHFLTSFHRILVIMNSLTNVRTSVLTNVILVQKIVVMTLLADTIVTTRKLFALGCPSL